MQPVFGSQLHFYALNHAPHDAGGNGAYVARIGDYNHIAQAARKGRHSSGLPTTGMSDSSQARHNNAPAMAFTYSVAITSICSPVADGHW